MANQYSTDIFLLYTIGNTLYGIWMLYAFLAFAIPGQMEPPIVYLASIGAVLRTFCIVLQWCIWGAKLPSAQPARQDNVRVGISERIAWMQAVYPIIMSCAIGSRLIVSLLIGKCDSDQSLDPVHTMCDNYFDQGGISLTLTIELMFTPILTFCLLRDTRVEALLASWAINVSVFVAYCAVLGSADVTAATLLYLFFSVLIYMDSQSRLHKTSDLVNRLRDTLDENERLAVEAQAIELRAMIGNIAHDLKSPLTSFLSGLECMLEVISSWEQQLNVNREQFVNKAFSNLSTLKKCLHSMSGTNSFMTMTINRCLDYTKASKGFKLVPRQETVALKSVLEMPIKMMREVQGKIDIAVTPWEDDGICSHVITDKQWLLENLLCLLSNAVKYSYAGKVNIAVYLVAGSVRDASHSDTEGFEHLRFDVLDCGIGLSDENMATLFNPFKQAQRLAGGTGLGLFSLAKRVEALHGTYGVSRRPDGAQGSLFWFTIPYRPDRASAAQHSSDPSPSLSSPMSSHNGTGGGSDLALALPDIPDKDGEGGLIAEPFAALNLAHFRVLVVDDAPLIVRMTTMLLTRKGHTVQHAVNGAEGLELILAGYRDTKTDVEMGTSPFDVVVMDLQMPIMDGIEAIRRLRAAECNYKRGLPTSSPSPHQTQEEKYADLELGNAHMRKLHACTSGIAIDSLDKPSSPRSPRSPFAAQFASPHYYHQYVIAVSANSDNETVQEALRAGADSFVSKPFSYDCFTEAMQNRPQSRV